MPILSRLDPARRVLLALSMATAIGAAHAGAVEGNALGASSPMGDAAQLLPPLGLPEVGNAAAAAVRSHAAASRPAPGSALAAEVMREAGTGLAEHPHAPQASGGPASGSGSSQSRATARAPQGQWDDAEIPAEIRSAGKAAVQWIKGMLPWSSDANDAELPDTEINWSNGPSRHGSSAAALLLEGAGNAARASNDDGGHGAAESVRPAQGRPNLLREGIEATKEVLSHPMTWLIVSLCVIGAIAVSLADRRPK